MISIVRAFSVARVRRITFIMGSQMGKSVSMQNIIGHRLDDDPAPLQLADVASGAVEHVAENVGRSLNRVPGVRAVSFVHKESPAHWWIKRLDLDSGETTLAVPAMREPVWSLDDSRLLVRHRRRDMRDTDRLYVYALNDEPPTSPAERMFADWKRWVTAA